MNRLWLLLIYFLKNRRDLFFILILLNSVLCFSQVEPGLLSQEIRKRFSRVSEFKFIQEEADRLGLKIYLFGGTASAFAHYVRWDLEREFGDTKYQKERFDYDFTNIYRGNQDLDIVVDGTAEQAREFQELLQARYPHFVGTKTDWEVRLLREEVGDKLPLLENKEFRNQHTDSNSIGMLDLTSKEGDIVFRDLLDWSNPNSRYLKDISQARIEYLFNSNHKKTKRYKDGNNPPILSAVRYLAKLTQYEVTGSEEDLLRIKDIIKNTDFDKLNNYSIHKLSQFSLKALLNSPNVEYAKALLDEVGLRVALLKIDENIETEKSLNWWMNKEPLKSKELGRGAGRTAKEVIEGMGLEEKDLIVAHETDSFEAYENITRSTTGGANVFISRSRANGELAVFGDGFYTALGRTGARGTDLNIRFQLNPKAREHTDFKLAGSLEEKPYIIILNKNALELIQEDINLSIREFAEKVMKADISKGDSGFIIKLMRKYKRVKHEKSDLDYIAKLFTSRAPPPLLLEFWFSLEDAKHYPEVFNSLFLDSFGAVTVSYQLIENLLKDSFWKKRDAFKKFINARVRIKSSWDREWILRYVVTDSYWSTEQRRDWLEKLLEQTNPGIKGQTTSLLVSEKVLEGLYPDGNVPFLVFREFYIQRMTDVNIDFSKEVNMKIYEGFQGINHNEISNSLRGMDLRSDDIRQIIFTLSLLKNLESFPEARRKKIIETLFFRPFDKRPVEPMQLSYGNLESGLVPNQKEAIEEFAKVFYSILEKEKIIDDKETVETLLEILTRKKKDKFISFLKEPLAGLFPVIGVTLPADFIFSVYDGSNLSMGYMAVIAAGITVASVKMSEFVGIKRPPTFEKSLIKKINQSIGKREKRIENKLTCKEILSL